MRSTARNVWSSTRVKSSVNQPSAMVTPSMTFVVRRARELGTGRHVGRRADLVLVPCNEHPVLGRHEVGLDEVGALADGELVRLEGVLGPVAAGAAVADDERVLVGAVVAAGASPEMTIISVSSGVPGTRPSSPG